MNERVYAPFISEIKPYLYLGNFEAATDENIILNFGIKRIISVTDMQGHRPDRAFCEKMRVEQTLFEIPDDTFADEEEGLVRFIFPSLSENESENKKVLVHCRASVSRSPSLIITYLMWRGMNFQDALLHVFSAHPIAAPKPQVLECFLKCIGIQLPESYIETHRARFNQIWWQKMILY